MRLNPYHSGIWFSDYNGLNMVRPALYSIIFFGFTIVQIYQFFFCEKETATCTIFFVPVAQLSFIA